MKVVLLAILAILISTSAFADDGDRYGRGGGRRDNREDARDDRRDYRDGRRDDRHDDRYDRDDRRDDRRDYRYGRDDHRDDRRDHRDDRRDHRYGRDERRHDGQDIWRFIIPIIVGGHNGNGYGGPVPYPTTRCESIRGETRFCYTGLRQITHVRLIRQFSRAPCINRGNNYYDTFTAVNGNIVVRNGCRGDFLVSGY